MIPILLVACAPDLVEPERISTTSPAAPEAPAPLDVDCPAGAVNVTAGVQHEGLQAALDAAAAGDTIAVCPGIHLGSFVAPVAVTLGGVGDAVLDGDDAGSVLTVPGGSSVLDLELTGGRATHGGGLFVLSPGEVVIARVRVHGNQAELGGGIWLGPGASAWLVDAEVHGNQAGAGGAAAVEVATLRADRAQLGGNEARDGGALACLEGTIALDPATELRGNAAENGGAIYADRCRISGGLARDNVASVYGGGLALLESDAARIEVRENHALYGGGVYALAADLEEATVAANTAEHGDGIYAVAGLSLVDSWVLDHPDVGLALGIDRAVVAGGGVLRNGIGAESSGGLGQVLVSERTDWGDAGDENGIDVAWSTDSWSFGEAATFTCVADACTR